MRWSAANNTYRRAGRRKPRTRRPDCGRPQSSDRRQAWTHQRAELLPSCVEPMGTKAEQRGCQLRRPLFFAKAAVSIMRPGTTSHDMRVSGGPENKICWPIIGIAVLVLPFGNTRADGQPGSVTRLTDGPLSSQLPVGVRRAHRRKKTTGASSGTRKGVA